MSKLNKILYKLLKFIKNYNDLIKILNKILLMFKNYI